MVGNTVQKGLHDGEHAGKTWTRNILDMSMDEETNFVEKLERENIFTCSNSKYN